ncbi:hypothetical protein OIU77_013442 [Salix suchowensis]|uniref:Pectinesterase inhibitor domain-containing protein n=1 Tax=Salix suchowensis TaxID=1278906 RepID=A0ABQ8ZTU3_9ROSI|nr:pectinesterase inhibitor [Salix suchowensis]KAJ6311683.1 hypothetical protein OIU77_013442 [Salix suchowensis]KAJ6357784.1 hypothetical protein OIU78_005593 [Salix suchowensis]
MKFLAWLPLFLLVNFLHQPTALVGADLVQETCQKTRYPDLCVKTLKSNPRSSSADVKGLAHIMLEANLANSKVSLAKVEKLLKESGDKSLKKCLDDCAEQYDTAANEDFPTAIQSLERNDLGTAKTYASAALDAPGNCRDTFSEDPGVKTPPDLTKLNDYSEQLSVTALMMLNNLG